VAVSSDNHFTSLTAGTWNYEDAKRQLLWEKYGTTENVTVTPEEVQTFIDQKEKESQRLTLYYNWQVVAKNALYLAVIVPLYTENSHAVS